MLDLSDLLFVPAIISATLALSAATQLTINNSTPRIVVEGCALCRTYSCDYIARREKYMELGTIVRGRQNK